MNLNQAISSLNPRQKEAVLYTNGPLLILAGAGSGKTRVITMRTAYLLDSEISPERILALTFTNKAANEMKERISGILKHKKIKNPIISTFHSLCLRILRNEIMHLGYRKDFTIYDTSEQLSLIRNLMSDVKLHDKNIRADLILEGISREKNGLKMIPPKEQKSTDDDILETTVQSIWHKYNSMLKTFNVVDFDDLLLLTLKLFKEHPNILTKYQDKFKYIMVDEYQDTNRVQYELIKLLAGHQRNICVVGDDDQSIYGWRGADIYNILDFEREFPGTKIIRLEQNYRSYQHILEAANSVIKNNKKRMGKALWTKSGLGPKVKIVKATDGEGEAQWIADRILLMKYEKNISFNDMAILYRANNLSRLFEEALRKTHIPYSIIGGTSYFERREVKDLAAYLKVITNPLDEVSLLRIVNVPKRGFGSTTMERFAIFAKDNSISLLDAFRRANEISDIKGNVAGPAIEFCNLIDRYRLMFKNNKEMGQSLRQFIKEINYYDFLYEQYKTKEVVHLRIENVENFIDSLSRFEENEKDATLQNFLESLSLADIERGKNDASTGVTLISFHSAKGLEFPIVFIACLEEDILPHKKSISSGGELEEERRLFYVGITRAKQELYLLNTEHRIKYGKKQPSIPSRFLEEIPLELTEKVEETAIESPEESQKKAKAFFSNIQKILG